MTRKTATLTVAGLILVGLLAVALLVPMPFVMMSPGVTENTLGKFDGKEVISIEGHKTYPSKGQLDLTTVSVTSPGVEPRLGDVLEAWWASDEIILPREAVYPEGETPEQSDKQNQADMLDSQSAAIAVGLAQAGIDAVEVEVAETPTSGPADGKLAKGDIIKTVDGTEVTSSDQGVKLIQAVPPGDEVTLGIERNGTPKDVTITTEASPDDPSKSRIGVTITTVVDPPFKVNIDLGQDIGGPSAGLMFSLAIYDKITPGDLTGGRHIAGTGTMDQTGTVGRIGGIQQKIAGAVQSGADVFLVPAGNCEEAGGSPHKQDIDLVKVETMGDAVDALNAINDGKGDTLETCG